MVSIIKEELPIEQELKKKIEFICEFAKTTPTIINSNIRKIDKTNLTYIEPNRIIIKDTTFLIFNYSNEIFNDERLSEKSKELNPIEWTKLMNNYKNMTEEIILNEYIFI